MDLTAGLMLAVAGLLVDAARELDAVVRDEVVEADRAAAEVDAAEEEVVRVEEADDVAAAVFDSDGLAVARDVLAEAVAAVAARVAAAARVRVTGLAGQQHQSQAWLPPCLAYSSCLLGDRRGVSREDDEVKKESHFECRATKVTLKPSPQHSPTRSPSCWAHVILAN